MCSEDNARATIAGEAVHAVIRSKPYVRSRDGQPVVGKWLGGAIRPWASWRKAGS